MSIDLENVLREFEISSFNEFQRRVTEWEDFEYRVWQGGQEKFDSLRQTVIDYYSTIPNISGQYISINSQWGDVDLDNYMCIFPKRTLIETDALYSYIDLTPHNGSSYDKPPVSFFQNYFRYEKLIRNNISYLYPIGLSGEEKAGTENTFDAGMIIPIKNVAEVTRQGNFQTILQRPDVFYLAFPWLYNANTDNYIEICDRYPSEFDCFANAIEKIALAGNGKSDLNETVLSELKEAIINIQIAYDKKKSALKAKGVTAVLGIALSCIPFALNNFFDNFDPKILSTVIGSVSLLGSKDIISDFMGLRKESNTNPFWVIWKWKQSTE